MTLTALHRALQHAAYFRRSAVFRVGVREWSHAEAEAFDKKLASP